MPPGDDQTPLKHVEVTVKTHCFYECFVLFCFDGISFSCSAHQCNLRNIAWIFINVCFQSFQCVSYDYFCNDLTNIKLHVSVLGINNLLTDPVKQTFSFACVFKNKDRHLIFWLNSVITDWMTCYMYYLHQLSLHLKECWLVWRDRGFEWLVFYL
jgi:hypothetical protein